MIIAGHAIHIGRANFRVRPEDDFSLRPLVRPKCEAQGGCSRKATVELVHESDELKHAMVRARYCRQHGKRVLDALESRGGRKR